MKNVYLFNLLADATMKKSQIEAIVKPVQTICDTVLPVLLALVGSIGLIYCVFLGVRYAKASEQQEHDQAKKGLKNAVIGFLLIFVLLIACKLGTQIFINWFENYNFDVLG